jgi:hypothetical protein
MSWTYGSDWRNKTTFGRPRRRYKVYIKLSFREVGCEDVNKLNWIRISVSGGTHVSAVFGFYPQIVSPLSIHGEN